MKHEPDKKCQSCSFLTDAGGFCDHLSDGELVELGSLSRTAILKRGESLGNKELITWPIIAISSGVISMQHLLEDGRKTIGALFLSGDIIDMRGISTRNSGSLIALSKTNVCRLPPPIFESIIEANPNAQRVAWNNLRNQTFRAINHSADLAKKQALEKLASFVFECRRHRPSNTTDNAVQIPVRRIDLAEYLGMQPETLSRCFHEMEKRGLIQLVDISNLIILNVPTLRRIANGDKNTDNLRHTSDDHFKVLSCG